MLSALARVLTPRLSEVTRVRVDVEAVGIAIYVALHALAGAVAGVVLGRASRAVVRALALAFFFLVADELALGALWRHRGLPASVGTALVGVGAVLAALGSLVAGAIAQRLPPRARAVLAMILPIAVVAGTVFAIVVARRTPERPAGETVATPVRQDGGKVAIVALDGLDGLLVDDALAHGRLPNLRALLDRGVRGDLRSIRPPKSPVVWTSVVTGVLPRTHGILDFVVRRDGERIPVTSNLRKVPALWNVAAPAGFTVAFVNWYVTWPAESVAGAIVSDRADYSALGERVHPPELTAAIDSARAQVDADPERAIDRFLSVPVEGPAPPSARGTDVAGWRSTRWGQVRRALAILGDVVRHDLVTLAGAEVVLARGQPDLCAFYFRGTDNTQHLFWKHRLTGEWGARWTRLLYGDIGSTEVQALAPVIDRYYDFADELLGRIVAKLEPNTAILVLSDHGFLTNNERGHWYNVNRLLEAGGFAVLPGGGGGAADSAASLVLDSELPSVTPRRVLHAGAAAGDDAAGALARARDFLAGMRTDRGEKVFRSVALGEEAEPRLAVVFADRLEGRSAVVKGAEVPMADFLQPEGHSGDHRMNGFLLAAGPPFRRGRVTGARAVDVAPTVLHLLGAPAALDTEGVVLVDLFDPVWRASHPLRYVASYGVRDEVEPSVIATEADARIREELQALGYLR